MRVPHVMTSGKAVASSCALLGAIWGVTNHYAHRAPVMTQPVLLASWLVFAVGVAIVVTRVSRRPLLAGPAVSLLWTVAVVAFFAWYLAHLVLGSGPRLPGRRINADTFMYLGHVMRWNAVHWGCYLAIALVGGLLVGWVVGFSTRLLHARLSR